MRVEIPAGAAAGGPHGGLHPALEVGVVGVLAGAVDLELGVVVVAHGAQRVADVGHLRLDHEHHARVPETGVGADDEEQVGEVGHGGALVGGHAGLGPGVGQRAARAPGEVLGDGELGGVEAGGHDEHVDGALHAVAGHDAALGDAGDRVGHEVDVVAVERRVVGVGDQDPLAADLEVGGDLAAQLGVRDALRDVAQGHLLGRVGQLRHPRERRHVALATPVDRRAVEALQTRHVAQRELLGRAVAPVVARQHVGGRALVDVEVAGHLLQLGHDLDRRGAGADDGDPLAGQIGVVVPARGVEDLTAEALDALDLGELGLGEPAGRADHGAGREGARAGRDLPALGGVVPARGEDRGVEQEAVEHPGLLGDALDVGLDLRLRRERHRPVRVRGEGVAVELARHVAGRTRVGVVTPGAPDVGALLDDDEVALAVLVELDRGGQSGEAGSDHQVVDQAGLAPRGGGGGGSAHGRSVGALLNNRQ